MTLADPKPVKRKKDKKPMKRWKRPAKTRGASQHLAAVKGCRCGNCNFQAPSEAHHTRSDHYGRPRASDWATIPLCGPCHRMYHADKQFFEDNSSKDYALIPKTLQAIYGDKYSQDH